MKKTTPESEVYVAAILNGDPILLKQMYQSILPLIRNLIQHNGGTDDDAKDIFQDAVMVIYQKARQPGFQLSSQFSTFFYGICRNLWGNRLQKKQFSEVTLSEDIKYNEDDIQEIDYSAMEQQKLFDKAFARLGADCQRLLLLYFQRQPMNEITTLMGYSSEGYARRRKFMCKEHLIEIVKSYPEYQELCHPHNKKIELHGEE